MNLRFGMLLILLLALSGCDQQGTQVSNNTPPTVQRGATCLDNGKTHAEGSSWTASDGCNQATCSHGAVIQTLMGCGN